MTELETKIYTHVIAKIEQMEREYNKGCLLNGCALEHLAELVKLCHQARSLAIAPRS